MERYIKANRKVAEHLHLQSDRRQLADGNFLLWLQDMLPFGSLVNLDASLSQTGSIALTGQEAREEQEGTVLRRLPVATDSRFVMSTTTDNGEEATS